MLEFLDDRRVDVHGDGFEIRISHGRYHVSQNHNGMWHASDAHTGEPAGKGRHGRGPLHQFPAACAKYDTAEEAVLAVLACDGDDGPR